MVIKKEANCLRTNEQMIVIIVVTFKVHVDSPADSPQKSSWVILCAEKVIN